MAKTQDQLLLDAPEFEKAAKHPGIEQIIACINTCVQRIDQAVCRAPIEGQIGTLANENVQGEAQKPLDVLSNQLVIEEAKKAGVFRGLASEELELPIALSDTTAPYLLLFDPLDGSSNIDINVNIGTIFSVLPAAGPGGEVDSYLQPGRNQVLSAFALYGASTLLLLTLGSALHVYVLDRERAHFQRLEHAMRLPDGHNEYAINGANQRYWHQPVADFIRDCQAGVEGPLNANFNTRWVASLVADAYRVFKRGGLYLYPEDRRQAGRLRYLYECAPVAMLCVAAGGAASDGTQDLLEHCPKSLHERTPLIFGERRLVARLADYY